MDNTYVYAQLDADGKIVYFIPYNGGLKTKVYRRGKWYVAVILNPTEAQMNAAGWYRVVNIDEAGADYIADNILYHYTGTAEVEEEVTEEEGSTTSEE